MLIRGALFCGVMSPVMSPKQKKNACIISKYRRFRNFRCDLVCSHTPRRSFATNLYLRGEPVRTIMDITGHSTVAQFMQYIKITKEESSMKLAKSAFFKKPTDKKHPSR